MKKAFLILLVTLNILSLLASKLPISAITLADSDDEFDVGSPSPNQTAKGIIGVRFIAYDDEQTAIPFTAQLFDRATCNNTNYGSITSSVVAQSNRLLHHEFQWNTKSTNSTAQLGDGEYCLKICISLKNNGSNYSSCNSRAVILVNNNRLPIISSSPTNLTIFEDSNWTYQIIASDPDGNALSYSLLQAPNFLSINPTNGFVSTNSNSKVLPSGTAKADYSVRVGVSDGLSGTATQDFTITVVKRTSDSGNNTGNNNQNNNGNNNGQSENQQTQINIINPTENEIFKGDNNEIKWEISDTDGVEEIKIGYSKDQIGWTDIRTLTGIETDLKTITWNVSELEDGAYYLEFRVKDSLGAEISRISPKFIVRNNDDNGDFTSEPLIINVSPGSNSQNEEVKEISGEFIASNDEDVNVESFTINLDDEDIKDSCEVNAEGFKCTFDESLTDGLHKVSVKISDTSKQEANYEWQFSVGKEIGEEVGEETEDNDGNTINLGGREIPQSLFFIILGICCLGLLLILIPWILYIMWFKGDDEDDDYYGDKETTVTTTDPVSPSVTTNYYNPGITDYGYVPPTDITTSNNYYMPSYAKASEDKPPADTAASYTYPPTTANYTETATVPGTVTQTDTVAGTPINSDYTATTDTSNYYEAPVTDTTPQPTTYTQAPAADTQTSYTQTTKTYPTLTMPPMDDLGGTSTTTTTTYTEPTPTDK